MAQSFNSPRLEYQRRTLQMPRVDTTSSKARRPLEDTQGYSISQKKQTGRACFDRVSEAQLNIDIMN
ncbi:hypothetical protein HAX54_010329, partial [Datura stramonium]|nr:hypothetical protein [Datura stramonium]